MEVLFAKYNRSRIAPFKIATLIVENEGIKEVIKKPLTEEAVNHLEKMVLNYQILKNSLSNNSIEIAKPKWQNRSLTFPYFQGESITVKLLEALSHNHKEKFYSLLHDYKRFIHVNFKTQYYEKLTDVKESIFGSLLSSLKNKHCFEIYNLDLNFDNIIVDNKNKKIIIDYEWVFSLSVPVEFTLFRSIYHFYFSNDINEFGIEFDVLCNELGIDVKDREIYMQMDKAIEKFVFESSVENYVKKRFHLKDLIENKENNYYYYNFNLIKNAFQQDLIDRLLQIKDRPVYIWGTGKAAEKTKQYIMDDNKTQLNLIGYIDNNIENVGKEYNEKKVFSPEILIKEKSSNPFIIIGSSYFQEIGQQLFEKQYYYLKDYCIGVIY
ncbi:MAG: hypothetical protein LPK26_05115 [Bacillaceae bacterium]|nr:hypothetical protein [Bacillaceae bacterium]